MNILNRPMFSRGDVVSTPTLSQEVLKTLEELGINPKNKTTEQLSAELESYIAQEKRRIVFDPTDPLDYLSAGLTATGIGAGAGLGIKALRTGVKGKKAVDKIGKLQKIKNLLNPIRTSPGKVTPGPLGMANIANPTRSIKIPQSTIYGGVAVDAMNPDDETDLNKALGIDIEEDAQEELNRLQASQNKEKLEKARKKAKDKKDEKEIKDVENLTSAYEAYKKLESEEYQKERLRKKRRNTDIFLEEMALSMAGTNNLADGLAIGAANAASKVGDADEAEALAYLELEKEAKEMEEGDKLKETTATSLIEKYSDAMAELDGSKYVLGRLNDLTSIYKQNPKNVTGIMGFLQGIGSDFAGAFNLETGELRDRREAENITEMLKSRLVTQLLGEKGKTISDADRKLVADLIGNLKSPVSNVDSLMDLLSNVREVLANSTKKAQGTVTAFEKRYEKRIPEFADIRNQYKINDNNYEIPEDDNEVSIADDPTVIQ